MPDLVISQDAQNDLTELFKLDAQVASRIAVLLQELQEDDDLLDRLTQHGYGNHGTTPFSVSKWFQQWNTGRDLWRLKICDIDHQDPVKKYRVIYAFIPSRKMYHVLAIAHRSFNYEESHSITKRIVAAYDLL